MLPQHIQYIRLKLSENKELFKNIFSRINDEEIFWKPEPTAWCMLEILCHLCDEEREDFRARLNHVLTTPDAPLPPIDPQGWVDSRKYMLQDFDQKLNEFFTEREKSIEWLMNLENPQWDNYYEHPKFGKMSAKLFFTNWLAHDYLHIRQILKLKFDYLKFISKEDLNYAGNW